MFYFAIALKKPALEARYTELLKIIGDVGKDVKPAYTNSKTHSDRLRKSELEWLKKPIDSSFLGSPCLFVHCYKGYSH